MDTNVSICKTYPCLLYAFLLILTVEKQKQKGAKECKFHLFIQMQQGEDKMFCLVRFLVLLIETKDTQICFVLSTYQSSKRVAPKGHITETHPNTTTCVADAWLGWVTLHYRALHTVGPTKYGHLAPQTRAALAVLLYT